MPYKVHRENSVPTAEWPHITIEMPPLATVETQEEAITAAKALMRSTEAADLYIVGFSRPS